MLSKLEVKAPPFKSSGSVTTTGRGSPMKATVDYTNIQQSSDIDSSFATSVATSVVGILIHKNSCKKYLNSCCVVV